jgi:nucleoid-associated protein YgaU
LPAVVAVSVGVAIIGGYWNGLVGGRQDHSTETMVAQLPKEQDPTPTLLFIADPFNSRPNALHLIHIAREDRLSGFAPITTPPVLRTAPPPSPVVPPPRTQPPATQVYVVQAGDTLWALAARYLGNPLRFQELFALNRGISQVDGFTLVDPNLIYPRMKLVFPADATGIPTGSVAGSQTTSDYPEGPS